MQPLADGLSSVQAAIDEMNTAINVTKDKDNPSLKDAAAQLAQGTKALAQAVEEIDVEGTQEEITSLMSEANDLLAEAKTVSETLSAGLTGQITNIAGEAQKLPQLLSNLETAVKTCLLYTSRCV